MTFGCQSVKDKTRSNHYCLSLSLYLLGTSILDRILSTKHFT